MKNTKIKKIRKKTPFCKTLNLEYIKDRLFDIMEECEEISWILNNEDNEMIIEALDGDEEEFSEFKIAFDYLSADCEHFLDDLHTEYVPECFDTFFVGIGAGAYSGGLMEWDEVEQDYCGIQYEVFAERAEAEKLKRLTKNELLNTIRMCFKIAMNFSGIESRYNDLENGIDLIKEKNNAINMSLKEFDKLYELAASEDFGEWSPNTRKYEQCLDKFPQEVWL